VVEVEVDDEPREGAELGLDCQPLPLERGAHAEVPREEADLRAVRELKRQRLRDLRRPLQRQSGRAEAPREVRVARDGVRGVLREERRRGSSPRTTAARPD
jgi:hypothetical protein